MGDIRIFRIFRVVRVARLLREYGAQNMLRELRNDRAGSTLYLVVFLVIVTLESAAVMILFTETGNPDANITTAADAIWCNRSPPPASGNAFDKLRLRFVA